MYPEGIEAPVGPKDGTTVWLSFDLKYPARSTVSLSRVPRSLTFLPAN